VVQKHSKRSRGAAKFISPARERWVKWNGIVECLRHGTVLTQIRRCGKWNDTSPGVRKTQPLAN